MKLRSRRTSHRTAGGGSEFKLSTKKVTEKTLAITGQYVAYLFCTKYSSQVLYARLAPSLHKVQPPDQAGFRPNHRCEDHLTVYRILEQRSREWGVPLYISTIDFTKAFDSIKHSAIWNSLRFYEIKPAYVKLLRKTATKAVQTPRRYSFDGQRKWRVPNQKRDHARRPAVISSVQHGATILAGEQSGKVARKQKKHQAEWLNRRLLDKLEIRRWCAPILHIAGETTWYVVWLQGKHGRSRTGNSPRQDEETQQPGQRERKRDLSGQHPNLNLEKKWERAISWKKITFEDQETEEVKNRLKAACAAFHKYRQELTSRDYRLCHRLRLLNMVITPTLTYASGTWTLTQKHEKMIKTAQRKMLRVIIQTRKYKTKR